VTQLAAHSGFNLSNVVEFKPTNKPQQAVTAPIEAPQVKPTPVQQIPSSVAQQNNPKVAS
jgi:hypothetical protein